MKRWSSIVGSGSYIPEQRIPNEDFLGHEFYGPDGLRLKNPTKKLFSSSTKSQGFGKVDT
ncbi:MAG: hypothetical protein OEV74_03795 [Cyclobacteriaceae bacterium]|nr:hypothetical protein [Cyclobacteriaceae bacterium]MDH4295379.1 hypothetical protein [Cyclobacteriaceae bacterium]